MLLVLVTIGTSQTMKTKLQQADKLHTEKSYQAALAAYRSLLSDPSQTEISNRELKFRIADCQWRAFNASPTDDPTTFEKAEKELLKLVDPEIPQDRVYADANVSLGDFYWTREDLRDWNRAFAFYQKALDFWAGSSDLETARSQYLAILFRMIPRAEDGYYYGNIVPIEIIDKGLEIAKSKDQLARLHYFAAKILSQSGGDLRQQKRIAKEFQAALDLGLGTAWHDDALFNYAQFLESRGEVKILEDGNFQWESDFPGAIKLYRQLIELYPKGKSRYHDSAKQRINELTQTYVNVQVPSVFLPESEIFINLSWRNEPGLTVTLYDFDLVAHLPQPQKKSSDNALLQRILDRLQSRLGRSDLKIIKDWKFDTEDSGKHIPGSKQFELSKLPVGSYLVAVDGGKASKGSVDLLLVSSTTVTVLPTSKEALFFVTDAITGKPMSGATIEALSTSYDNGHNREERLSGVSDANGIWKTPLKLVDPLNPFHQIFAVVKKEAQVAILQAGSSGGYNGRMPYKIDVSTDRPAYRPNDQVQFNAFIRHDNGSTYTTPASKWVQVEVQDQGGKSVFKKEIQIDEFGSVQGDFTLDEKALLGMYQIQFFEWDPSTKNTLNHWGSAQLFRLEEYKLPEFKVQVSTAEKTYLLGDKVKVKIQADTYFGSPVSGASVEVVIKQSPFYFSHHTPRPYPWYYEGMNDLHYYHGIRSHRYYGGGESILKRETLKTDAQGSAVVTFETPGVSNKDFQYTIEARVTDSSRREIIGVNTIKVTRQSYYVFLNPAHQLYRPNAKATVNLVAKNANDENVDAEGKVIVSRQFWILPKGQITPVMPYTGQSKIYPPPHPEPQPKLKTEVISTQNVKIKKDRGTDFEFTPEREGFYKVEWVSKEQDGLAIKSETTLWVCTRESQDLGYTFGGIQIVLDKDTYQKGERAQAVVITPKSDSWVLFTTEATQLLHHEVLHLDGTAKFIEIAVQDEHQPNFFINVLSVRDRQLLLDRKEIIVPPVDKFLNVQITSPKEKFEAREKSKLDVLATDYQGKPVSAQIALSLFDASTLYIQSELTSDIRQFFYSDKRQDVIDPQNSFHQRQYMIWFKNPEGFFIDEFSYQALMDEKDSETQSWKNSSGNLRSLRKENGGGFDDSQASEEVSKMHGNKVGMAAPEKAMLSEGARDQAAPTSTPIDKMPDPELAQITVRSDFRNTILWKPTLRTDAEGRASVEFEYPDSLTTWKASARAATTGSSFGNASSETKTSKALIVRLQAPRFFTQKDQSTLSAVVNNNTDQEVTAKVTFDVKGLRVTGDKNQTVKVKPNSEARVDLPVTAEIPGTAQIKVYARAGNLNDAMERSYLVIEHGIEKFVAYTDSLPSGSEKTAKEAKFTMNLPKERVAESTQLKLNIAPSLAVTCLDALPYLLEYPYGCVEQTMSRFLPATIVARLLEKMKLDPKEIEGRMFGGVEPEHAKATHKNEKASFSKLAAVTRDGLNRLYDMQHEDGGWGWWQKGDSDHYMTAYVVQGLWMAKEGGIIIREDVLQRGMEFLRVEIVQAENQPDMLAWMLYAASFSPNFKDMLFQKQVERLWTEREKLNPYTLSLFALAMEKVDHKRALVLIRNLENGVQRDEGKDLIGTQAERHTTATAHWGKAGIYYRWSEGGLEGTAFALKAMLAIDPKNTLVQPVMTWLVRNRRGAQWNDTRDTAIVVLALTDYMKVMGETQTDFGWTLFVNGKSVAEKTSSAKDASPLAPSEILVPAKLLQDGANEIRIERKGSGPLYYSAYLSYYSLEDPIPPAGNEIFVKREYFRYRGRPTLLKGLVYDKVLLKDGETLQSGDRVEVKLTIEAKNDLEYLVFEDLKPAGCEAVQIQSGEEMSAIKIKADKLQQDNKEEATGTTVSVHQELRDRKVAFFISKLKDGVYTLTYDLRAEAPGHYHALPTLAHAMYVPEIRGNSGEIRMKVEDAKE
jgi:alpha-2-macroglobulin